MDSCCSFSADDISDPTTYLKGYPWKTWDELRRDAPVFWASSSKTEPFWAITRHSDVVEITRRTDLFTNAPDPLMRSYTHREAKRNQINEARIAPDLLELDGSTHRKLRKLFLTFFSERVIAQLRAGVGKVMERLIFDVRKVGTCRGEMQLDFVQAISSRLPLIVICDLLGVPESDRDILLYWISEWVAPSDPSYQRGRGLSDTLLSATTDLYTYVGTLLAGRADTGTGTLLNVIKQAMSDGLISLESALSMIVLLLVAGSETTKHAVTGGILAFSEHPKQWNRLAADNCCMDSVVNEVLRWSSPVIHFARTALSDVAISGKIIKAGQLVVLFYPSANRDGNVFNEPYRFDIDRHPNPHVTFGGFGPHHCLGMHLGRLELEICLSELSRHWRSMKLVSQPEWICSNFIGGAHKVLLSVVPI